MDNAKVIDAINVQCSNANPEATFPVKPWLVTMPKGFLGYFMRWLSL